MPVSGTEYALGDLVTIPWTNYSFIIGEGAVSKNFRLGTRVDKTTATLPASTTDDLFTVAGGNVMVTLFLGEVTTIIQAQACNLSVNHIPTVGGGTEVLASVFDINGDVLGSLYHVEGDGTALLRVETGVIFASAIGGGMILAPGTTQLLTAATNTGATKWQAWYIPLDDSATMVAA